MSINLSPNINISDEAGLICLINLFRFHGLACDLAQLRHDIGITGPVDAVDLVRQARRRGMKSRLETVTPDRLSAMALPAIAVLKDGGFLVLAKAGGGKVLVLEAGGECPLVLEMEAFTARWSGTLVMVARRASLGDLARRFDIGWFLSAMVKYRGLLTEVLVASLFCKFSAW